MPINTEVQSQQYCASIPSHEGDSVPQLSPELLFSSTEVGPFLGQILDAGKEFKAVTGEDLRSLHIPVEGFASIVSGDTVTSRLPFSGTLAVDVTHLNEGLCDSAVSLVSIRKQIKVQKGIIAAASLKNDRNSRSKKSAAEEALADLHGQESQIIRGVLESSSNFYFGGDSNIPFDSQPSKGPFSERLPANTSSSGSSGKKAAARSRASKGVLEEAREKNPSKEKKVPGIGYKVLAAGIIASLVVGCSSDNDSTEFQPRPTITVPAESLPSSMLPEAVTSTDEITVTFDLDDLTAELPSGALISRTSSSETISALEGHVFTHTITAESGVYVRSYTYDKDTGLTVNLTEPVGVLPKGSNIEIIGTLTDSSTGKTYVKLADGNVIDITVVEVAFADVLSQIGGVEGELIDEMSKLTGISTENLQNLQESQPDVFSVLLRGVSSNLKVDGYSIAAIAGDKFILVGPSGQIIYADRNNVLDRLALPAEDIEGSVFPIVNPSTIASIEAYMGGFYGISFAEESRPGAAVEQIPVEFSKFPDLKITGSEVSGFRIIQDTLGREVTVAVWDSVNEEWSKVGLSGQELDRIAAQKPITHNNKETGQPEDTEWNVFYEDSQGNVSISCITGSDFLVMESSILDDSGIDTGFKYRNVAIACYIKDSTTGEWVRRLVNVSAAGGSIVSVDGTVHHPTFQKKEQNTDIITLNRISSNLGNGGDFTSGPFSPTLPPTIHSGATAVITLSGLKMSADYASRLQSAADGFSLSDVVTNGNAVRLLGAALSTRNSFRFSVAQEFSNEIDLQGAGSVLSGAASNFFLAN